MRARWEQEPSFFFPWSWIAALAKSSGQIDDLSIPAFKFIPLGTTSTTPTPSTTPSSYENVFPSQNLENFEIVSWLRQFPIR